MANEAAPAPHSLGDQIERLKHLQLVDGELYQLRQQLRTKPLELEATRAQVSAQEAKVKAADERVKVLQMSHKTREMDLQTKEASIKKLQSQLFQLKTNQEYTTMQREINTIKADNSVLEESILKGFDEIEMASQQRLKEQQLVAEKQAALKADQARVDADLARIQARITELDQKRATLTPSIPPATLSFYERILVSRNGLALVPLTKESCGGCHRRLPPQFVNEVMLNAKLVTCENCNRILYADAAG